MKEIISTGIIAAREAGALLLANADHIKKISVKKDKSLVTNLDTEAENIIVSHIKTAFPGHGILCEESGMIGSADDYIWIIDPLDGTHNYIRGLTHYGVSIGVVHKDAFVAGIIFMPADDALYVSEHGGGAFKNEAPIHVSDKSSLDQCTLAYDSCIREDPELKTEVLSVLGTRVFNIRMFGASTTQLTLIAEGKIDAAVEFDDKPWDLAAGASLILEAGGVFTDILGNPTTYKKSNYLTGNRLIYEELKSVVSSAMLHS